MFEQLRQRVRDMRTVSALCQGAERHANAEGQHEPGAEHFLLAALELPDGTARRAFERVHSDPSRLRQAIKQQYEQALHHLGFNTTGLDEGDDDAASIPTTTGLYRAAPSGQAIVQALQALRGRDPHKPLLGAHVVELVADMERGVAARSLQGMGIERGLLRAAARAEVVAAVSPFV
jgi:ATP-dependent Clp protease ATP-binding subunit ClpA